MHGWIINAYKRKPKEVAPLGADARIILKMMLKTERWRGDNFLLAQDSVLWHETR
jgi:hypothetical protein